MNVQGLLKAMGDRVVTTYPEMPIQTIARRMTIEGIGAIVVVHSADDRIAGLISERDIACALSKHGSSFSRCASRIPDQPTALWVDPPSIGVPHLRGALSLSGRILPGYPLNLNRHRPLPASRP